MKTYRILRAAPSSVVGIGVVLLVLLGVATAVQAETEAGVQVLTRGPVHEAFATAAMTGATAGVVISKAPPEPIEELPPDQRPEGANVSWIPGYWSWDDDRDDFIWISGVWRVLPPSRQWVPGYWRPVEGGSQFVSGYWADVAEREVAYLPPPPEPLEVGPTSPAPGHNLVWAPGCWVWQDTRYAWQAGYWVQERPDWVWIPSHYEWTPRGYVYVPGYWDYDLGHRGVMFAPVYYEHPVYARPDYYYSPAIVIDIAVIATSLFLQPRSCHYYYGDYYDSRYEGRGIYPWHSKELRRYGDDPIYVQYRSTQLRRDPNWDTHIDEQYRYRREHVDARPPQTLALQVNVINNQKSADTRNLVIGRPLTEVAQSKTSPVRFTPVAMDRRREMQTQGREVNKFQVDRRKMEASAGVTEKSEKGAETAQPIKVPLPASPVAARTGEKGKTPPPMPALPKAEPAKGEGGLERPQRGEPKTEGAAPQTRERAQQVESKPEQVKPETRQQIERKPEPVRPETKQQIERKPEQVRPETKQQIERKPEQVKPETRQQIERKPEQVKPETRQQIERKPEQVKPETRQQIERKPEQVKPETRQQIERKPEPVRPETRQQIERKPEPVRPETRQQIERKPEQVRPETRQPKAEPMHPPAREMPQQIERKPEVRTERPEARPAPPQVQSRPQIEEPRRNAPPPEMRQPRQEPQAQPPRVEPTPQHGKPGQTPNTEDDKNKKNEVR